MIAVKDLALAKEFYGGRLGLRITDDRPGTAARFETKAGTWFLLYRSESAGMSQTTSMRFEVDDIEATVKQLRERGIAFEDYDLPGLKTVEGIATHPSGARGAWFRDPDGNILQIGQYES